MAGGATSALIPLFAHALGGGLAEVGIIAAATSIASVPAFILWGVLSDRLGRRKPVLLLGVGRARPMLRRDGVGRLDARVLPREPAHRVPGECRRTRGRGPRHGDVGSEAMAVPAPPPSSRRGGRVGGRGVPRG